MVHFKIFQDKTGFFMDDVDYIHPSLDSRKDLNSIARVYGILSPKLIALRYTYGLEAIRRPELIVKGLENSTAEHLSAYFLEAEDVWVSGKIIREYIRKSINLRRAIDAKPVPIPSLDGLEKAKLEIEELKKESYKRLWEAVLAPVQPNYVKYDVTLDTAQMLLYCESQSEIPFATMKKMRKVVLGVYGDSELPKNRSFIDHVILYRGGEGMKFFPSEKDQTKKLRFRLFGLVAAESDDMLEGIKKTTQFLENNLNI